MNKDEEKLYYSGDTYEPKFLLKERSAKTYDSLEKAIKTAHRLNENYHRRSTGSWGTYRLMNPVSPITNVVIEKVITHVLETIEIN